MAADEPAFGPVAQSDGGRCRLGRFPLGTVRPIRQGQLGLDEICGVPWYDADRRVWFRMEATEGRRLRNRPVAGSGRRRGLGVMRHRCC